MAGTPPGIEIQSTTGDISLKAPLGTITLDGLSVEIKSDTLTHVTSTGIVQVEGDLITLN
jgi:hypothetical protein